MANAGLSIEGQRAIKLFAVVLHWVRNLSLQPESSFWLQTSTDRFYPDFVAETLDGRLLVVEYKGQGYIGKDSDEKKLLGEVWAGKSNGRALFLMAVKKDEHGWGVHDQIKAKIEGW